MCVHMFAGVAVQEKLQKFVCGVCGGNEAEVLVVACMGEAKRGEA